MQLDGQVYFDDEDEIPQEDIERFNARVAELEARAVAGLQRWAEEATNAEGR